MLPSNMRPLIEAALLLARIDPWTLCFAKTWPLDRKRDGFSTVGSCRLWTTSFMVPQAHGNGRASRLTRSASISVRSVGHSGRPASSHRRVSSPESTRSGAGRQLQREVHGLRSPDLLNPSPVPTWNFGVPDPIASVGQAGLSLRAAGRAGRSTCSASRSPCRAP